MTTTPPGRPVRRRSVLAAGGLAGLGAALAACSGGSSPAAGPSSSTPPSSTAPPTPSSGGAPPPDASVALDEATRARLDRTFDEALARTGVVGMGGAVTLGDGSWTRTGGVADLGSRAPYPLDGFVRIASITKTFVATAVLRLVDQGALALSDPLQKFVPGVANGDAITVEDLLAMRSGIPDFTADPEFGAAFRADPTMAFSQQQFLDVIARRPPTAAPGTAVAYDDSNYWLLGSVLEQVARRPRGQVVTDEVISRLPLPGTSYPTTSGLPSPHATGYLPPVADGAPAEPFDNTARPPGVVEDINPEVAGTAGAMVSTVADLQVWGRELAEGTLLAPRTQALRLASRPFPGQKVDVGYGLGVLTLNELVGHDGSIFGSSTVVLRRPQTDFTVVLTANESTNSTTPTLTAALGIVSALYPDQVR